MVGPDRTILYLTSLVPHEAEDRKIEIDYFYDSDI